VEPTASKCLEYSPPETDSKSVPYKRVQSSFLETRTRAGFNGQKLREGTESGAVSFSHAESNGLVRPEVECGGEAVGSVV
jgi:hypothetical protein